MPVALLSVEALTKSFTSQPLFENISFTIAEGDHVGLVGPNGSGKSTLLEILAGIEEPDAGTRSVRKGLRIGYVPQDPVFAMGKSVADVVFEAVADDEKADVARRALAVGGFTDQSALTDTLSGGWRKRLAIVRALALEPDVLLLDEPTNHLDVEGILWLESLMRSEPEAFVAVSHDRYFLENVARRMIELNRTLLQVDGGYSAFLAAKDEMLKNGATYQERLANLVRREIEWLSRGPKARTTKAKARVSNAERLIEEQRAAVQPRRTRAALAITDSGRKTKRLWVGEGITKAGLFRDLDLLLTPGMRLGVLGPNGAGKTTLLRVIVGEIPPDAGTITKADQLRVVYFEQNRESLDPNLTLKRALAPEGDSVLYRDRSVHVASWAKRFLFRPEQLDTSVSKLSGGEKARIVLARLMLQPADLLVLDEPTNDLDIPTLDVLEEALLEFPGALVLVTHDRYLLDRVSTQILALDGRGNADSFADYAQWEARPSSAASRAVVAQSREKPKKKLGYLEQRELDSMEERIVAAEERLANARQRAQDPEIASDAAALQDRFEEIGSAERDLDTLYGRWAELSDRS